MQVSKPVRVYHSGRNTYSRSKRMLASSSANGSDNKIGAAGTYIREMPVSVQSSAFSQKFYDYENIPDMIIISGPRVTLEMSIR